MSHELLSELLSYDVNDVLESDMSKIAQRDFDQICGYSHMKNFLLNHLVNRQNPPQQSEQANRPLLICGHPGVGKSLFIEATAHRANKKLYVFNLYSLGSSWLGTVGSSGDCIKAVFTVAYLNSPCILCLEDIDVLGERNEISAGAHRELLLQLLNMNKCECDTSKRDVTVIATTQRPWNCDHFLLDHFQLTFLDLPTCEERIEILKRFITDLSHDLNDEILAEVGSKTHGFTISDLIVLARQASMMCVRNIASAQYFKKIYIPARVDSEMCKTLEKLEPGEDYTDKNPDKVLYNAVNIEHSGEEQLNSLPEIRCGVNRDEMKCKDNPSDKQLMEHSDDQGEGQPEERFTPCEAWEEGALKTSFTNIPAGKIWQPFDVTKEALINSLNEVTSSVTDELDSKMKHFRESYCCLTA